MSAPTQQIWEQLAAHASELKKLSLEQLFAADESRAETFSCSAAGIELDYSKNFFNAETRALLTTLCQEVDLAASIQQMYSGAIINNTEQRAVLHTLLRASSAPAPHLEAEFSLVQSTLKQIAEISEAIRSGTWLGSTGLPIKEVVHIGIGGSFLGPNMVDEALASQRDKGHDIRCHYVANVDAHHITEVLSSIDAAQTLVIIVSKTFTTLETKANAETARLWLAASVPDVTPHLLAVSANTKAAEQFGVAPLNILPMWDWVGGRYSLWSAVGIPIAIRYGYGEFAALLRGAAAMDQHFLEAKPDANLPVLLGFIGLIYQHGFGCESHGVLTYDHRLRLLPDHLQQVDMESNGKSVRADGNPVAHHTGAIIWGGEGTNGQHAFHQLLHQGTRFTSIDFIITLIADHDLQDHHDKLVASALSQAQALMVGRSFEDLKEESSELKRLHRVMPGNRPSNTIVLERLNAETVGALIALYEHKVFVQGLFWGLNSFDQWGVELGKELGERVLGAIQGDESGGRSLDPSTARLIKIYKEANRNRH